CKRMTEWISMLWGFVAMRCRRTGLETGSAATWSPENETSSSGSAATWSPGSPGRCQLQGSAATWSPGRCPVPLSAARRIPLQGSAAMRSPLPCGSAATWSPLPCGSAATWSPLPLPGSAATGNNFAREISEDSSSGKKSPDEMNKNTEFKYQPLFDYVRSKDWISAQEFLEQNSEAIRSRHPTTGQTALYIAAFAGNMKFVEELVRKMEKQDLEIPDYDGDTALLGASLTGIKGLAKCMVEKNPNLVSISRGKSKQIPVVVAASFGHVDLARYLYFVTPLEDLKKDANAARLLNFSIEAQDYDIVLDLLDKCKYLAITSIKTLAAKHGLFPSTCRLNFWQKRIYARRDVPENLPPSDIRINVETQEESQTNRRNISCQGVLKQLTSIVRKRL
ncbi:hypothetical protein UlMin_045513, partial [Ulmus minor]